MKELSLEQLLKYIPKKHRHKLQLASPSDIDYGYGDTCLRLFLATTDGWCFDGENGLHLKSVDTVCELKSCLLELSPCHCKECEAVRQK